MENRAFLVKDETEPNKPTWFFVYFPDGSETIHLERFEVADRMHLNNPENEFAGVYYKPRGHAAIVHSFTTLKEMPADLRRDLFGRQTRKRVVCSPFGRAAAERLSNMESPGCVLIYGGDDLIIEDERKMMICSIPRKLVLEGA